MEVGIPTPMSYLLSIVRGHGLESQLCHRGKLFKVLIMPFDLTHDRKGKGGKEC